MPGPPPKRSEQRRRVNTPASGAPVKAGTPAEVSIPDPDEDWHPIAAGWYRSLGESGQSAFYTSADWHTAYVVAESMSREFKPQPVVDKDGGVTWVTFPPKAAAQMAWLKACSVLLVTEGDRRRVGLELQRPKAEEAQGDVSELDEFRQRLRSG